MSAKEIKFIVTEKKSGISAVVSFDDLYGYEGLLEGCGICIKYGEKHIPKKLWGAMISFNSGYEYRGMNPDYKVEPYKPEGGAAE